MTETTTIEISRSNWQKLNARKEPGDSFNDVVGRLLEGESGRESGGSGIEGADGGVPVECVHCGHEWTYTGSSERPTCPSCTNKTPRSGGE